MFFCHQTIPTGVQNDCAKVFLFFAENSPQDFRHCSISWEEKSRDTVSLKKKKDEPRAWSSLHWDYTELLIFIDSGRNQPTAKWAENQREERRGKMSSLLIPTRNRTKSRKGFKRAAGTFRHKYLYEYNTRLADIWTKIDKNKCV